MRDADNPYQDLIILDGVDDSVLAPAGGPVTLQIESQWLADSVRIGSERPEQEGNDGDSDRFRKIAFDRAHGGRGKDDGVGPLSAHVRRAASAART